MSRTSPSVVETSITNQPELSEWRHAPWLVVELIGVTLLIWHGLPIYRAMLDNPHSQIRNPGPLVWALIASVLVQAGYWYRYYEGTPTLQWKNAFAGHFVLFVSRLSFLFASTSFGYIFITGNIDLEVSGLRYFVFFVGLFSLFCFVRELESIGAAMCAPADPRGR